MAQTLRRNTLRRIIQHIALLLLAVLSLHEGHAQTILLPGDIVIVSVSEDGDSFDFIPLIDIEKGTSVYFSDGTWNEDENRVTGNNIAIYTDSLLEAGSIIHIGEFDDTRISKEGRIDFKGSAHQLFAYQEEGETHRIIYGVEWGDLDKRASKDKTGYPYDLAEKEQAYLVLGTEKNYQYHIRNGASGTQNMLRKFVGNPGNWRAKNMAVPVFGTSFNLLKPPVVLFENSVSTISEGQEEAVLNVSVYGHDGSRATVEVFYHPQRSSTDEGDIAKTDTTVINFTGLVGDGVYEVKVPLRDDEEYEGLETGIFVLNNLSKGNFGDFLSHSLIINDDEIPETKITNVIAGAGKDADFIEIENREDTRVQLQGWTIKGNKQTHVINTPVSVPPGEKMYIVEEESGFEHQLIVENLSAIISDRGGEIILLDNAQQLIHEVIYSGYSASSAQNKGVQLVNNNDSGRQFAQSQADNDAGNTDAGVQLEMKPGWKVLPRIPDAGSGLNGVSFYYWDEPGQILTPVTESSPDLISKTSVFGYFNNDMIRRLSDHSSDKNSSLSEINFYLTATDYNGNNVIDGLEGLNLVSNNASRPFEVHVLLNEIQKIYPDLKISPYVYTISENVKNDVEFRVLTGDEKVHAYQPFWVKVEEELSTGLSFSLNPESFDKGLVYGKEYQHKATFGLLLTGLSQREQIELSFNSDPKNSTSMNLGAFRELQLPNQERAYLAISRNGEYLRSAEYDYDLSHNLSLPLSFGADISGEFSISVSEWEDIPGEWNLVLEDLSTGEEYKLDEDFEVSFRYQAEDKSEGGDVNPASAKKVTLEERFMLKVLPPLAENQTDESIDEPKELELYQNFPNPFNPYTTISFYLPEQAEVKLSVFNIVGQPVAVLVEGSLSTGRHEFEWDATDMPSSMYIYQLEVGNKIITRKMTLVK